MTPLHVSCDLGPPNQKSFRKLTSLQNKAIWAVGGLEWNESFSLIYYQFKVFKLHDMYKYKLAKFMHQVKNKTLPTPLMNSFDTVK